MHLDHVWLTWMQHRKGFNRPILPTPLCSSYWQENWAVGHIYSTLKKTEISWLRNVPINKEKSLEILAGISQIFCWSNPAKLSPFFLPTKMGENEFLIPSGCASPHWPNSLAQWKSSYRTHLYKAAMKTAPCSKGCSPPSIHKVLSSPNQQQKGTV